jgi:CO/xanthine dehydrogenase Mo-binding subunit
MKTHAMPANVGDLRLHRRHLVKSAGALVVTLCAPVSLKPAAAQTPEADQTPIDVGHSLDPTELDTWLAITEDGNVTAYFGKMDMGQGVDTGIAQFVAEELDVAFERVTVVMGDTALTVNQGGASNASGIEQGSWPLRNAAAEARRVLLDLAARQLGVPVEDLSVAEGVVSVQDDPTQQVAYGELIGNKQFNIQLEWNETYGNSLDAWGTAKPKTPDAFKIVGTPVPRTDVPAKVFGQYTYIDKISLPGMLHGRMIRPRVAGAMPQSFDESSISDIPGVQVILREGVIGLVAENEWDAVKAASQLDVTWSDVEPPFIPMEQLYDHIRQAPAREGTPTIGSRDPIVEGDLDAALEAADRLIEAEYEWPFNCHACMGPACAVADVRPDEVVFWTGSQKPHQTRDGIAALLGRPPETVRGIWVHGPGSYGRNEADDAACDAVILSEEVGRPVRVQYMRHEGHGWDPKGPATVVTMRAGLDENGEVIAYEFYHKGFSGNDVRSNASDPNDTLTGQLLGLTREAFDSLGVPKETYAFPNERLSWEVIDPLLWQASPLRTSHIRDPQGPQVTFSSESFIDELAAATGSDPVEFRLRYVTDPRDIEAITTVAKQAGWKSRPSPNSQQDDPEVLNGRGIAYAQRGNTVVAIVSEVEVNRETGRVWPRRFTVAHDCGLVVNPRALRNTIEGAVLQSTSRTIWEEVQFDENNVTSLDWSAYPILDIVDAPEEIDIVLIDRPELPPYGAGEPAVKPVAAAIANAVFDATGARIRRVPLRPERVKAAMDALS